MGQTDIPLNALGISQALAARNSLANLGIKTICYSPLQRAKMTAEILNQALHCELVPVEELQEFNLGSFSGKNFGPWFEEWRQGQPLPGAETYAQFVRRCTTGINRALAFPETVLIVAHGGVYWALEEALRTSLNRDLPNCIVARHIPPQKENTPWKIDLLG